MDNTSSAVALSPGSASYRSSFKTTPGWRLRRMYAQLHRRTSSISLRRANRPKSIYAGISAYFDDHHASVIAISVRDTTYLLDSIEKVFEQGKKPSVEEATEFIVSQLRGYGEKNLEKIIGAAMPGHLADHCPRLCSRLWAELDIIPLVLPDSTDLTDRYTAWVPSRSQVWEAKTIDEQAEAMSRKCVR